MVKAQSPLQAQNLTPMLRSGQLLLQGQVEWFASGTIASVWAQTPDYTMDYYHNEVNLGVRWAPRQKWELEVNFQHRFAGDNGLDSVTEGFHDLFGLSQNGREQVDKHRFYISAPKQGVEFSDFEGDTLNNVLSLYGAYQWIDTDEHALSIGVGMSYNYVGSGDFKTSDFEQLAQINYLYRPAGPHRVYGTLGTSHSDDAELTGGIERSDWAWMGAVGYEYRFNLKHAVLVEYHAYSGETEEVDELDEISHEFLLGYRYSMKTGAIEFTMIENVFNMDNSTDIAFTLGYRHRI